VFRALRETWLTLAAIATIIGGFFRKWFLPLHADDEEAVEYDMEETGDDDEPGGFRGLLDYSDIDDESDGKPDQR
jgi:hypothetical protein